MPIQLDMKVISFRSEWFLEKTFFLVPGPLSSLIPTPVYITTIIPLAVREQVAYPIGILLVFEKFFLHMRVRILFFILAFFLEPAYLHFPSLLLIILCKKETNAMKL